MKFAKIVFLIAGVWEPWYFLRGIAARLNAAGHPIYVARRFGYNNRSITDVAILACAYLEEKDLQGVTILAHSKGGLVGKQVMATTPRVDQLVAIVVREAKGDVRRR